MDSKLKAFFSLKILQKFKIISLANTKIKLWKNKTKILFWEKDLGN